MASNIAPGITTEIVTTDEGVRLRLTVDGVTKDLDLEEWDRLTWQCKNATDHDVRHREKEKAKRIRFARRA